MGTATSTGASTIKLYVRQVREPDETRDGVLRVGSLPDLFATKLNVIYQRAEARDYLDVHALLMAGLSLRDGLTWTKELYGADFNIMLPLQPSVTSRNRPCGICLEFPSDFEIRTSDFPRNRVLRPWGPSNPRCPTTRRT
jgi:hypothetical protein